ncbi:MAG: bifunctional pyr operon transcriptional regulator/uracil phosphoribosyltransferase, partial [Candidatus Omnitrophica bacterium]|nr:bifunctional pyr operon transcriptional regulator/uracil phosphoribosyltransferase [Candidatus Omnitrophota bacterium]
DDVLYTGRTIRAALDELIDFGRPEVIKLLVLIDRDNRELPIQPDFIGKRLMARKNEMVEVKLKESDAKEEVVIIKKK